MAGTLWDSVVAKMNLAWGGRLFECLEQRIERVDRDHVNFVDDDDFVRGAHREVLDILIDLSDIFHGRVRRTIDLLNIDADTPIDFYARSTGVARIRIIVFSSGAVESFCKDAGNRGLANASDPAKEKRMTHAAREYRIGQRLDHMVLTYYI